MATRRQRAALIARRCGVCGKRHHVKRANRPRIWLPPPPSVLSCSRKAWRAALDGLSVLRPVGGGFIAMCRKDADPVAVAHLRKQVLEVPFPDVRLPVQRFETWFFLGCPDGERLGRFVVRWSSAEHLRRTGRTLESALSRYDAAVDDIVGASSCLMEGAPRWRRVLL